MGRVIAVGDVFDGPSRVITWEKMVEFESVIWNRGDTAHNSRETANKGGLTKVFASGQNVLAFFHELFEKNFGDGWIEGGTIAARWTRLVYEGDTIVTHSKIDEIKEDAGGRKAFLTIWAENQNGEQTAAGKATAFIR